MRRHHENNKTRPLDYVRYGAVVAKWEGELAAAGTLKNEEAAIGTSTNEQAAEYLHLTKSPGRTI
ncbi:hypothetical protein [Paraburkholderia youngii]|uniref:hypothetical protein n=1 Tax=Paraburkholderia youngii TaxID=2782701 RepID=UPI0020D1F3F4|nr:hypothetical protein [Paraburkholderia youngii]